MGKRGRLSVEQYVEGIRAGDIVTLSRAITLVESRLASDRSLAAEVLDGCLPYTGQSVRLGITGAPGVGKSTFIETFGQQRLGEGYRLAVLTIDPSSQRHGGSLLGDKTRMPELAADERAYIRPSPSGPGAGGINWRTREAMLLCEAAGFDLLLIETVGVGQSETLVAGLVDFFLLLQQPGGGDQLQGIKRGIMELADGLLVTKADGANAERARQSAQEYRSALQLLPPDAEGHRPFSETCSAQSGQGMAEAWQAVQAVVERRRQSSRFHQRRREQARQWLDELLRQLLFEQFFAHAAVREQLPHLQQQVQAGEVTPYKAALAMVRQVYNEV